MTSALRLGIDTGGTFTDAVLLDEAGAVVASAKALTTKDDLSVGIGQAMAAILNPPDGPPVDASRLALVAISTTLATNAVVENHGQPVCLIMIGETEAALDRAGLRAALGPDPAVFVAGGHGSMGEEAAPLDMAAVDAAIDRHGAAVSAYAVSGHFATRNPAHERQVRDRIQARTGLPVTCGHDLSAALDMPRRALTAVLNARLIPMITDLIAAVRGQMDHRRIAAPLMVVKGDGSLITADMARLRPVETVLSGPAASVVGARHLTGADNLIVADMGGTTTDIALMRGGQPALDPAGAKVAGWQTMVSAIAVHTVGLGGDSEIRLGDDRELAAGPRRAIPLSLLAAQHDGIVDVLEGQAARTSPRPHDGRFALRQRSLSPRSGTLSPSERKIWDRLEDGPVSLERLFADRAPEQPLRRLVDRGLVAIGAFTPSDAAHVLGLHTAWNHRAAELGATLFARLERRPGKPLAEDGTALSRAVYDLVLDRAGMAVTLAILDAEGVGEGSPPGRIAHHLIRGAFGPPADGAAPALSAAIRFGMPLAAIGAPAATYYPELGRRSGNAVVLPPHGAVSNAVGAVAGGVMQTVSLHISAPRDDTFRVHMPDSLRDFGSYEDALENAEAAAARLASERALGAGAAFAHVSVHRDEKIVTRADGPDLFLECTVTATATGRPAIAG